MLGIVLCSRPNGRSQREVKVSDRRLGLGWFPLVARCVHWRKKEQMSFVQCTYISIDVFAKNSLSNRNYTRSSKKNNTWRRSMFLYGSYNARTLYGRLLHSMKILLLDVKETKTQSTLSSRYLFYGWEQFF